MWSILTDYEFTRRKTFNYVVSPDDQVAFRHRHLWPCVAWLYERGVYEYRVAPAGYPDVPPMAVIARAAE